ncbi:hypothetical protein Tco_1311235 [Tanacetum coccineum]
MQHPFIINTITLHLAVPMFQQEEDPIECINKVMAFLSAVALRFLPSNNQLIISSNPRNQATIQDDRVTVQQVQGRQTQKAPVAQQTILQNSAFQTEYLDAYDSDCDDLSLAKAVLMANLSSCDLEVLSEVPYSDSYPNDMINQDVQEMQYSEQINIIRRHFQIMEIHSDSISFRIINYLQSSKDAVIQATNSYSPNDLLVYLSQRIQPTLYDGSVIAKEHAVISVFDDEETLILEEESQSKMLDKQNDPISIKKKIKISSTDYSKLNKIKEDFGKRFVTKKELSAKQAFYFDVKKSCVNECNKCLELETELLKKKDLIEKDVYDKLLKSYSTLEKHCISLELTTQLNQEVFQKDNFRKNQNAPTFNQLFELNELKAQSQEKDTVIRKLKDRIKSLSGKNSLENVKKDIDEIETINILEHSLAKLLSENENLRKEQEHLKSIYKDQFDSIRKTRVQSKEYCDSLIAQINAKSLENSDLNAQL